MTRYLAHVYHRRAAHRPGTVSTTIYVERVGPSGNDDELEVQVQGHYCAAEPDVGMGAGFEDIEASRRPGGEFDLTEREMDRANEALWDALRGGESDDRY